MTPLWPGRTIGHYKAFRGAAMTVRINPERWRLTVQTFSILAVTGLMAVAVNFQSLFYYKFIQTWDLSSHYSWAIAMVEGLKAGSLYPRWSSASNFSLGEPSFYYCGPITYYICAIVYYFIGNVWKSLIITVAVANWASGLIVFYHVFFRLGVRCFWATVGALLIQSSPFFFLIFAFNGAFSWVTALPLYCLVYLLYSRQTTVVAGIINPWLAVGYALLCMTHVLSGFMVGITLGVGELLQIVVCRTKIQLKASLGLVATLGLGMALAGAYLVPALSALSYVSPEAITSDPTFDWRSTFAFAVVTGVLYGVRWKLYQYAVAAVVFLPIATNARYWAADTKKDPVETRLLVIAAVTVFFSVELSAPIWAFAQPLHLLQFCYRFLAPASVLGLLACAWRLGRLARFETLAAAAIVVTVFGLVGLEVKLAAEGRVFSFNKLNEKQLFSDRNLLPAVRGPNWPDYGASGGFAGECARLRVTCLALENRPQARKWRITIPDNAANPTMDVRLPAFAFPTWSVLVNDVEEKRESDPDTGAILARLTTRDNLVELRWTPLIQERLGWIVTAIATVFLVAYGTRATKSRLRLRRRVA